MKVDKVPILSKINKTLNSMMLNLILLAIICLILGIVIPFYPQVLDILIAAFLIVSAVIFLNMAWQINGYKKKYMKYFE